MSENTLPPNPCWGQDHWRDFKELLHHWSETCRIGFTRTVQNWPQNLTLGLVRFEMERTEVDKLSCNKAQPYKPICWFPLIYRAALFLQKPLFHPQSRVFLLPQIHTIKLPNSLANKHQAPTHSSSKTSSGARRFSQAVLESICDFLWVTSYVHPCESLVVSVTSVRMSLTSPL